MLSETLPLAATDPSCDGMSPYKLSVQRLLGYYVHVGQHKLAAAVLDVYNRVKVTATAEMVPAIFQDLAGYGGVLHAALSNPEEAEACAQLTRLESDRMPQEHDGKVLDMTAATALVNAKLVSRTRHRIDHGVEYAVRQRMAATTGSIAMYNVVCDIVAAVAVPGTMPYVVPGGVKKLQRIIYKSVTKYAGDVSCCNDVVRCTVVTGTIVAMSIVVEAILDSKSVIVVRMKNRFARGYDATPSGGYLDFQMLVVFDDGSGRFQFGEIQVNLESMVKIKERPGGGHAVFKYARSLAAFDANTYSYSGLWSDKACERIKNGVTMIADMESGRVGEGARAAILGAALSAPTCRVTVLK
jgi:hypothetical protein